MNTIPLAETKPVYVPLPGRSGQSFGLAQRQRLLLGPDHLLVITTSFATERYNRFYLRDIQMLTVQKTAAGAVLNVSSLAIAGLFAALTLAGYTNQWDPSAQIVLAVIASLFAGIAIVNTALGPTCQSHILTAVHEEPLHCLGRMYTAQRVVEYLRAVIEEVQGTSGDLSGAAGATAQRFERVAKTRSAAAIVRKDSGLVHAALFGILLADSVLCGIDMAFPRIIPAWLSLSSNIAILTLVVSAAIRQRDSDVPAPVRMSVWVALAFNAILLTVTIYVSTVLTYIETTEQPSTFNGQPPGLDTFIWIANGVSLAVNTATAAVGFALLRVWRRAAAAQAEQQRVETAEDAQA